MSTAVPRLAYAAAMLIGSSLAVPACGTKDSRQVGSTSSPASASASASASGSASGSASASASASDSPSEPPAYPGRTEGCPDGMVRVDGEYCPLVGEACKKHHKEWEDNHDVSERCLVFEEPTKCLSKERVHLSFCVDRWEWPNKVGELPQVLTSWREAVKLCAAEGKRLCTEDEFNFACEGPEMRPHVYGFVRDDTMCNIDKPYRKREKKLKTYAACLKDAACREHFEMLDQRHKIGEDLKCVSWAGAYDMNGNVNEWVNLPKEKIPNRSGLKGGWWGPVRNRCRPTVTFHKEEDFGYEAGFRCCKDAQN